MSSSNLNCLFVIMSFIGKEQQGQICLQKFTTFCDNITFVYNLTINANCCKLLMSSFFVVWHVNQYFEPKLAYFDKYLSMEKVE